jgi:adenylate kinase
VNIILLGAPGAGKGTQANNIVNLYNLYKISTGDLLRDEIKNKTSLGIEIESKLEKGSFVSDDIINNLIAKILSNKKLNSRLLFDGYPRNINQAKTLNALLQKYNLKLTCALVLNVDKESIVKRILGRQICTNCGLIFNNYFNPPNTKNHQCDTKFLDKRSDDTEETIAKRFDTYLEKTLPVLDFYKEQDLLHQIDGLNQIDKIFEEIRGIIAPLEA